MRQNKSNGVIQDYFNQNTVNDRLRRFKSLRFGTDFFIDNRNTIIRNTGFWTTAGLKMMKNNNRNTLILNRIPEYYGNRFANGRSVFKRNSTKAQL